MCVCVCVCMCVCVCVRVCVCVCVWERERGYDGFGGCQRLNQLHPISDELSYIIGLLLHLRITKDADLAI